MELKDVWLTAKNNLLSKHKTPKPKKYRTKFQSESSEVKARHVAIFFFHVNESKQQLQFLRYYYRLAE